jgi:7-cyano-7-deazaguanine reductase
MSFEPAHLGQASVLPASPQAAVLDYPPNPHPDTLYLVRFAAPEFTSLCPVTGQPDFAHLVIDYVPGATIVESKSLKLFLGAFRNHAAFHESCTVGIGKRLRDEMRLLVSAWWHADRRVLAIRATTGRPLAARSGRACIPRKGLTWQDRSREFASSKWPASALAHLPA